VIVIADTSPINYLILIGEIDILPLLYPAIVIPPAVAEELRDSDAPNKVRAWISAPPGWLIVNAPVRTHDERLSGLDSGERDAIALALQMQANLLLVDERDARAVAEISGLAVERLQNTNFRASPLLFEVLLEKQRTRR
jgi:predicted nucleic acid-binding protein